jgi:hypothetical protein
MTNCHVQMGDGPDQSVMSAADELHHLKTLLREDPAFAKALRCANTTEEAAQVACDHGIAVTPEALWRNRGTLESGGMPTWRG